MHPLFKRNIETRWMRRALTIVCSAVGVLIIYALSFGPVLRVCHAKASRGWSSLPTPVRFVYTPLVSIPPCWFTGVLDRYAQLWMDLDH